MNSTDRSNAETEIRTQTERWLRAVVSANIDEITAVYAPDIVAFDAVNQLQFSGLQAYRKHWQTCLDMCPGPMIFELHQFNLTVDQTAAFAYALVRCGAISDTGEEKSSWMRMTVCYRKLDGRWKVVHEHYSAPFDMQSGEMLFDLKP